ncbi:UNVERIFIED_ORG: hypothetical protein ABIC48_006444 [Burkholderia territorii]
MRTQVLATAAADRVAGNMSMNLEASELSSTGYQADGSSIAQAPWLRSLGSVAQQLSRLSPWPPPVLPDTSAKLM